MDNTYINALRDEFRNRVFDESYARLLKCLSMIEEEHLWKKPNEQITSIGSSILHVAGNANQWISMVAGIETSRDRDKEFETDSNMSIQDMHDFIEESQSRLEGYLLELKESNLLSEYVIQGFKVSGLSAIIHVIEHMSYHTGQVTLMTKQFTAKDTGYYEDYTLS